MNRRVYVAAVTTVLLANLTTGATAAPTVTTSGQSGWQLVGDTGRHAPPRFVAFDEFGNERSGGFDGVGLDRASDGSLARKLLGASHHKMTLGSVALDPAGLLVTYSRGPACTSGVAGCGPQAGTCASEIDRFDVESRSWTRLVKGGSDQLIGNARLSPNGRFIAYSESPCVPSYFNDHLRVLDLVNWSSWTIGAGLPRCHDLWLQGWTLDSASLLVDYAPAKRPDYHGADGICPESGKQHLEVVDALSGQDGVHGRAAPTHRGCQLQSAAAARSGLVAVEACGSDDFLNGPVRLIRFNAQLHRSGRVRLGRCTDGNEVAANRAGTRWLISAYLYCGDPAHPVTKVWAFDGQHVRHIVTRVGGDLTYSSVAW